MLAAGKIHLAGGLQSLAALVKGSRLDGVVRSYPTSAVRLGTVLPNSFGVIHPLPMNLASA